MMTQIINEYDYNPAGTPNKDVIINSNDVAH